MSLLQHPHFRPRHYLGGSAVIFFIVLLYGFSLSAVFSVGSDYALSDFLKDDYLHQVIAFSFGQAFLELHPTKYAQELVKKMNTHS